MDTEREVEAQEGVEAQESQALLHEPAPVRQGRAGAIRVIGVLGVGAVVAIGAKNMVMQRTVASTGGIVQMVQTGVCSHNGGDCRETKCCVDPSSKCFSKNDGWASCNTTCAANSKWDHEKGGWGTSDKAEDQWDCTELTLDADVVLCANPGESCEESRCCQDALHKCFRKEEGWATCNSTCTKNMEWQSGKGWVQRDHDVWDCADLSKGGGESDLAEDQCTKAGENCMLSKCCSQEGHTCYRKEDGWASCNLTCSKNMKWVNDGWEEQKDPVWGCEVLTHNSTESATAFCDLSGCAGCSDDTCSSCQGGAERDCCLARLCDVLPAADQPDCRSKNLETCCEGKWDGCKTTGTSSN